MDKMPVVPIDAIPVVMMSAPPRDDTLKVFGADLAQENVVLITPIGASPSGEIFNLAWEEVAEAVAVALKAEKLIYLCDAPGLLEGAPLHRPAN